MLGWVLASFGDHARANGSSTDPSPKAVLTLPGRVLSGEPLVVQVAPPDAHRRPSLFGFVFEPCRVVALLGDSAWASGRRPAPLLSQQDPDAACPVNVGLPRHAVRPMDRHPRLSGGSVIDRRLRWR